MTDRASSDRSRADVDALEVALLHGDREQARVLLKRLEISPPSVDVADPRSSAWELVWLARALGMADDVKLPLPIGGQTAAPGIYTVAVSTEAHEVCVWPSLAWALTDADEERSWKAVWAALIGLNALKDVQPLLRDEDKDVRLAACEAWRRLATSDQLDDIQPLLRDENWAVRLAACRAWGQLANPDHLDDIQPLLWDENWDVRLVAWGIWSRLATSEQVGAVLTGLRDEGVDEAGVLWRAWGESLWRSEKGIERDYFLLRMPRGSEREQARVGLVRRWLTSPARRLMQDLKILRAAPGSEVSGAVEWTLPRIYQAAGIERGRALDRAGGRGWLELHAAVPGELAAWQPVEGVAGALKALSGGSPVLMRGAALAWLLGRAAREPVVSAAGIRGDLREILPFWIAASFQSILEPSSERDPALELERVLLRHAARLTRGDEGATDQERWRVARWLHGCLTSSPFHGSDPALLAVRLEALLPVEQEAPRRSPLAPERFGHDGDEVDLLRAAVTMGAAAHYGEGVPPGSVWSPTPASLAAILRAVAQRPLTAAELDAEGAGGLGHTAPALVARQVMMRRGLPWLAQAVDEVHVECIKLLQEQPERYAWLIQVVFQESETLGVVRAGRWVEVWRGLGSGVAVEQRALLGVGLLGWLAEGDIDVLVGQVEASELGWQLAFWSSWLQQRREPPRPELALGRLIDLAEREDLDPSSRRNAAFYAARGLQRYASLTPEPRERLGTLAKQPLFAAHADLRRELKRIGLVA